jgi:hypothetical protein
LVLGDVFVSDDVIIVPEEDRVLSIREESAIITVPPEWRSIRVLDTMLVASKSHTAGDTRRWTVQYGRWLDNTATIESVDISSDTPDCDASTPIILGTDVVFMLSGGTAGERVTLLMTMTDSLGNVKTDTLKFIVVAP